ncbi:hypothetical protein ACFVAE_08700 [Microbacterium sp. NPDC057659]|uniref:hypothetical protein n=1 Tax=Microbacterium sp. NPDC057659 TaxID=3346198 RepID=UPI00366EBC6A
MSDISFDYPRGSAIPIAHDDGTQQTAAEWAAQTAAEYASAVTVPEQLRARLEHALTTLAAESTTGTNRFLLVGTDALALAPFTIVVAQNEFTRDEQAEFLWSPSAILPPGQARIETDHLGAGISSTLAQREDGADFATTRWLFFGQGLTVGAVLGPVPPYMLAVVLPTAEEILKRMQVSGFTPLPGGEERVDELVAAVIRGGDEWQA